MVRKKKRIKKYNKVKSKPDAFYHSFWFTKVINKFMQQGKKTCVEKSVWTAFNSVKWKTKKKALFLLFFTLMKIRPTYGFITKRFGKDFKIIPFPLFPRRQIIIALKWFVIAIKINKFSFAPLEQRIRLTLLNFVTEKSTSLRKRHLVYTNALYQNRLNIRFRWK